MAKHFSSFVFAALFRSLNTVFRAGDDGVRTAFACQPNGRGEWNGHRAGVRRRASRVFPLRDALDVFNGGKFELPESSSGR